MTRLDKAVLVWLAALTGYAIFKPGRVGPVGPIGLTGADGQPCKCECRPTTTTHPRYYWDYSGFPDRNYWDALCTPSPSDYDSNLEG